MARSRCASPAECGVHAGSITLLDRALARRGGVPRRLRAAGWTPAPVAADVFEWLRDPGTPRFDAIFANLFLHHFERARLANLLRLAAAKTRLWSPASRGARARALAGSRLSACGLQRRDAPRRGGERARRIQRARDLRALEASGDGISRKARRSLFSHVFTAERR
jgi:hypothetical protein